MSIRVVALVALLTLASGASACSKGVSTVSTPAETSTADTTESIVQTWMAAIQAKDPVQVAALYSQDAIWTDEALGDRFTGRAGVERGWGIFSLPGFEIRALDAVAVARDSAVVRWTLAGTESPFSGKPWEVTGLSVLEISNGLITAETVYYDSAHLR